MFCLIECAHDGGNFIWSMENLIDCFCRNDALEIPAIINDWRHLLGQIIGHALRIDAHRKNRILVVNAYKN